MVAVDKEKELWKHTQTHTWPKKIISFNIISRVIKASYMLLEQSPIISHFRTATLGATILGAFSLIEPR